MVKDRISGTVVMSAEEAESSRKGLRTLDKLYNMAINGLPTSKPADKLGMEYLQKYNGDQKKATDVLIRNQVTKCTTTDFSPDWRIYHTSHYDSCRSRLLHVHSGANDCGNRLHWRVQSAR